MSAEDCDSILRDRDLATYGTAVVREAGALLLTFHGRTTARVKGHHDLITEADTALESLILGKLRERCPGWQHISEEDTAKGVSTLDEYCWVLDPLDGTVNFATGVPSFCISLALLHRGSPVLGWVMDPLRNELFFAQRGGGSFLNGVRLNIESNKSILIGTDSSLIKWCLEKNEGARLTKMMETYGKSRNLGAQALHLCYVAAGRLVAAVTKGCKIWDDAAGALII
jgi:myo-inositol-1(or 4)-monophosphatase